MPERVARQKLFWKKVENFFRHYEQDCSFSSRKLFVYREGWFLLVRFIFLYASFAIVGNQVNFCNLAFVLIGVYFLFDIVMVNTSISFVTKDPINKLRSFLFSFFTFTHIIVAFGIFYKFVQEQFVLRMCDSQVLYFSTVTITTLGYGDFVPEKSGTIAQMLVILEVLTGLFFITGVFARIISLEVNEPNETQIKE